ncbi:unnamed protein product [Brassica oleracea]
MINGKRQKKYDEGTPPISQQWGTPLFAQQWNTPPNAQQWSIPPNVSQSRTPLNTIQWFTPTNPTMQTIEDESNAAAGTSPNDSADHISHTPRLGGLFIIGNIYKYK